MKKILLLSNNDNSKELFKRLKDAGCEVIAYSDAITTDTIDEYNPDLVVSYNYSHIVKRDVIDRMGDRIINMHTSLLPWNKGSSPNIWSFIDDTPKGVTIHRLEKGLDTGKIILQKELFFDEEKESLSSTYDKLQKAIVDLFMDNLELILSGDYEEKEQTGKGTYHRMSDLKELLGNRQIDYSMTIKEFKEFAAKERF